MLDIFNNNIFYNFNFVNLLEVLYSGLNLLILFLSETIPYQYQPFFKTF